MSDFTKSCLDLVEQAQKSREKFSSQEIKSLLDHTCLNKESALEDLVECANSLNGVACVCVYPENVQMIKTMSPESSIATVLNFPSGNQSLAEITKDCETALLAGAEEFDMVLPYRLYIKGDTTAALAPIHNIRQLLGPDKILKVILETGAFENLEQIKHASMDCVAAGADFIKTSTGKTEQGATLPAVAAILLSLKSLANDDLGCKVSGGLTDLESIKPYLNLACLIFGRSWIQAKHFRLGASRLLTTLDPS